MRFIDLFCGIGGFRYAIEGAAKEIGIEAACVLSSDIDKECQKAYSANFHETPHGDIHDLEAESIPDHDVLLAGFPCQPFSIIGQRKGFDDARGTLFFEIARILKAKKPKAFVLENVKLLVGHNKGQTLARILEVLRDLGYYVDYRVFNALDFGLPQKRERVFIVGFRSPIAFSWPEGKVPMKPLQEVLETEVQPEYYASERIQQKRFALHSPTAEPTIWHENKAGNVSVYPYSCALRAGASYNYLLVNGQRRLTQRELLRLQGFPDTFEIVCSYGQTRKQAGNSLPIPVAKAVLLNLLKACQWMSGSNRELEDELTYSINDQFMLFEKKEKHYDRTTEIKKC